MATPAAIFSTPHRAPVAAAMSRRTMMRNPTRTIVTQNGKDGPVILVGTSGWQYDDWRGDFYPKDVPKKDWLPYFSERFPVVEVNNTFYNLPAEDTFVKWRQTSADDFELVVKASRYITHIR